jgi:putative ABC transport system substrate-binding protein
MKRREFITLLGGAAVWPIAVKAQRSRRLGVLMSGNPSDSSYGLYATTFVGALRSLGWIDGQNLHIDYRWTGDSAQFKRAYAAELVALVPDVMMCATTDNLTALQQETRTIPIVFTLVTDPLVQGFVASLAHPGGNITGFTAAYETSFGAKWLDLLKKMAPALTRVAVMFNPETSTQSRFFMRSVETSAGSLGVQVTQAHVRRSLDIESVIDSFAREPNGGLILLPDSFTRSRRDLIVELIDRNHLPAIFFGEDFVRTGGLMSYGPVILDYFRGAASYVDRILKGAKPADLPVQQPNKFDLVINLRTAKALGLEVPVTLLAIADEVIE